MESNLIHRGCATDTTDTSLSCCHPAAEIVYLEPRCDRVPAGYGASSGARCLLLRQFFPVAVPLGQLGDGRCAADEGDAVLAQRSSDGSKGAAISPVDRSRGDAGADVRRCFAVPRAVRTARDDAAAAKETVFPPLLLRCSSSLCLCGAPPAGCEDTTLLPEGISLQLRFACCASRVDATSQISSMQPLPASPCVPPVAIMYVLFGAVRDETPQRHECVSGLMLGPSGVPSSRSCLACNAATKAVEFKHMYACDWCESLVPPGSAECCTNEECKLRACALCLEWIPR
jgi:hypothetical protein